VPGSVGPARGAGVESAREFVPTPPGGAAIGEFGSGSGAFVGRFGPLWWVVGCARGDWACQSGEWECPSAMATTLAASSARNTVSSARVSRPVATSGT
jgi:hypothetical protein